jgi:hypothetical protein
LMRSELLCKSLLLDIKPEPRPASSERSGKL